MNEQEKNAYHQKSQKEVDLIVDRLGFVISDSKKKEETAKEELKEAIKKGWANEQMIQRKLTSHYKQKQEEGKFLKDTPYFSMLQFADEDSAKIAKFSLSEEKIYSWVTPIAALRFEDPGEVYYKKVSGEKRKLNLERKDNLMIQKGKIVFLSTETQEEGRTLVYQDYFSNRKKTSFVLPEIVAQMEKSQDQVIRARVKGPLAISGPAGSGKTTLALHRVAYLLQSPNLSDHFKAKDVIVFVQDAGTREYFSALLPDLGIHGVKITTFADWAMDILGLQAKYCVRIGKTEPEKDIYIHKKLSILQKMSKKVDSFANLFSRGKYFEILESIYSEILSENEKKLFEWQKNSDSFDRVDLTILLKIFKSLDGEFTAEREYYRLRSKGAADKKIGRFPLKYTLMIFDEFQNYIGEQVKLAKTTLSDKFDACMYIGDMNQQTWLGTLQNWSEIDEDIASERQIELKSVYRNTKEILKYISNVGYTINISDRLPEGKKVEEIVESSIDKQIGVVEHKLKESSDIAIGILGLNESSLSEFKNKFSNNKNIHIMTIHESQGVEFDTVYMVGIDRNDFFVDYGEDLEALSNEKKLVLKDLLYVGLTRAMNELVIVGPSSLRSLF